MKFKVLVQVEWPKDVFLKLSDIAEVKFVSHLDRKGLIAELQDADALVAGVTPIDKEILDKSPKLKVVARFGVGYDNVDVEECTKRGIWVTYTPNALSEAVADLTLGLMICLARRIVQADRYVRRSWGKPDSELFPLGVDLSGKVLGIIGLGRIGSAVAKKALAFNMEIIYFDTIRKRELEENLGVKYVNLDFLLRNSDFISIHVPLTESTRGLIGAKELKMMKRSAYIINTARGPIIDENALCKALSEGWISGAALDVFEKEPLPLDSPLRKLENVILTPHIGSASRETRRRMAEMDVKNIRAVLEGKAPPNPVPEQKGLTLNRNVRV
ncbi:D-glycerate dehydrogenase [Candidatus Bathyarchaeota archaeon]|nr:MAG: D-glycerate dehydrogenase [Candidatus Bathyarchaeota archaeon]